MFTMLAVLTPHYDTLTWRHLAVPKAAHRPLHPAFHILIEEQIFADMIHADWPVANQAGKAGPCSEANRMIHP